MHKIYFPKCTVDGPYEPPVYFCHMGTEGFIPNKCGKCEHLFEGECLRAFDETGRYHHLDFGPCGISGETDPVKYEDNYMKSKVNVPRKCVECVNLFHDSIYGFTCNRDPHKWGGIYRGLDWGTWHPEFVYFDLPPPKITTLEMSKSVISGDVISFLKEYRRVNVGLSLKEAKKDYALMRQKIVGEE